MEFLREPVGDEATSEQRLEGVDVVDLEELVAEVVAATAAPTAQPTAEARAVAGGAEVVGDNLSPVPASSAALAARTKSKAGRQIAREDRPDSPPASPLKRRKTQASKGKGVAIDVSEGDAEEPRTLPAVAVASEAVVAAEKKQKKKKASGKTPVEGPPAEEIPAAVLEGLHPRLQSLVTMAAEHFPEGRWEETVGASVLERQQTGLSDMISVSFSL